MSKTIHMSLSVRGALKWPKAKLRQACEFIRPTEGGKYTPDQLRDALLDELAAGTEVLPMGACEGFDPKKGCPGHEQPEPARVTEDSEVAP